MKEDYISGEKFIKLSNNNNIFYCHTHDVNNFFKNPPQNDFVLISHNSDAIITDEPKFYVERNCYNADVTLIPNNLIHWFGQNVGIKNDKIESLPVGLENSYNFPHERKTEKIFNILSQQKNIKNLMYVNINVYNNINERGKIPFLFSKKPWVTYFDGMNGVDFNSYLDNIYNHHFVISPIGGGFESHRLWESLYLGSIPIVKRCINYSFYEDLPICFVDDYSEITEDFLKKELLRIRDIDWNLDKLKFSYWEQKIKNIL